MPKVDGVRDVLGNIYLSLNPLHSKWPPGRSKKRRIESEFQDKRIVHVVIWLGIIGKHAKILWCD